MAFTFIDTHCHFDFPLFAEDAQTNLKQAAQAGVRQLIVPSVKVDRFAIVSQLSKTYSEIYAALGLHPLYIHQHNSNHLLTLEKYLSSPETKPVAIGEIGLDHYMEDPQPELQLELFRQQIRLAKHYELPVILHSRRTHDIMLKELRQVKLPRTGVLHGFTGSLQQANAFIKAGYLLGVGGTITYARARKTRSTLATVPLSSLLLETDAPDMPIAGYQGQVNRPERLVEVFFALCELRKETPAEIATQIYQNTCQLFDLN